MKSKMVHQHPQALLKREKKISPHKQSKKIQAIIKSRYEDMKLLIAFAVGKKTLSPHRHHFLQRTAEDDQRLLWSLRQLREQVHGLEQELSLLKEKPEFQGDSL